MSTDTRKKNAAEIAEAIATLHSAGLLKWQRIGDTLMGEVTKDFCLREDKDAEGKSVTVLSIGKMDGDFIDIPTDGLLLRIVRPPAKTAAGK